MIKSVNTIQKLSLGQYGKNQSNTDIFHIGPIPVSPITARSEPARRFDIRKEKSRKILDWLINKGIITWCFSYWPSYRSSICCIGLRLRFRATCWSLSLSSHPLSRSLERGPCLHEYEPSLLGRNHSCLLITWWRIPLQTPLKRQNWFTIKKKEL
jgi:hypothetical protein